MSQHPFYSLNCPNDKGQLLLTPCPGTMDDSVEAALNNLKSSGAKAVITLMTLEEMAIHHVEHLNAVCSELGLDWIHLPIADEGAPDALFENLWVDSKLGIHQYLDQGDGVVIHCKGGSGRTGVVAARILMERGMPMENAIEQVKHLRPKAFSHQVQTDYIEQLEGVLKQGSRR